MLTHDTTAYTIHMNQCLPTALCINAYIGMFIRTSLTAVSESLMHTHTYEHIYIHTYIHTYMHYTHTHTCIGTHLPHCCERVAHASQYRNNQKYGVRKNVYTLYVCVYVCVYVYMYICMPICVYVCLYLMYALLCIIEAAQYRNNQKYGVGKNIYTLYAHVYVCISIAVNHLYNLDMFARHTYNHIFTTLCTHTN